MTDSRVPLKDPRLAAILAYLIPGAGHLYQGRTFKGALYLVCILGTFFYGLHLGNWQVVYYRWDSEQRTFGYLSQVMVGLPALPSLLQSKRYSPTPHLDPHHRNATLDAPISAPFRGVIHQAYNEITPVEGTIELSLTGADIGGRLTGKTGDGEAVDLQLRSAKIQPSVFGSPERTLECLIDDHDYSPRLEGTIDRPFRDWFQVPLETSTLETLNGKLGKHYELALVYTWIAGLLNVLAIWDALEGPAYGYGDEDENEEDSKKSAPDKDSEKPALAAANS